MNVRNYGIATGRLTRDPNVIKNTDGSHKVLFTLAVSDNFKLADNSRSVQYPQFEAFVSNRNNGIGVYGLIKEGDLVTVQYKQTTPSYMKDGQKVYRQINVPEQVEIMEAKSVTDARHAQKAAAAANNQGDPAASAPKAPAGNPDEDMPFN